MLNKFQCRFRNTLWLQLQWLQSAGPRNCGLALPRGTSRGTSPRLSPVPSRNISQMFLPRIYIYIYICIYTYKYTIYLIVYYIYVYIYIYIYTYIERERGRDTKQLDRHTPRPGAPRWAGPAERTRRAAPSRNEYIYIYIYIYISVYYVVISYIYIYICIMSCNIYSMLRDGMLCYSIL